MAAIKVLVVGDGPFMDTTPSQDGMNMATTQDVSDNTFTVAEFQYLLRNNAEPTIEVDTAHRRNDPGANFPNFVFTTTSLAGYDVLWLFGYEGWNYRYYGSPITSAEVDAITAFMQSGGGVFATGDHAGMGSYMCGEIPRVKTMRKWFGQLTDMPAGYPTTALDYTGATVTSVNWPGITIGGVGRADTLQQNPSDTSTQFQFDDQSDNIPQTLSFPGNVVHPILRSETGTIDRFPDHMHEGEVVTPASLSTAEYPKVGAYQPAPAVIATGSIVGGHSTVVEGTTCEINNFTTDDEPTVANTIGTICAYDGRGVGVGRIVTDGSFHHYLDLNLIGDPCGSSLDRTQGFGPGYVLPAAGSILADLQAFYVNTVVWLARVDQNVYFSVDKSTFGVDEASDNSTFPVFSNAFWIVVNGYSPNAVQSALNAHGLQLSGAFAAIPGLTLTPGALVPELVGSANTAQRVLIPFTVQFSGASIPSFPTAGGNPYEMILEATLTVAGTTYAAEAVFELTGGQDPYFLNVNPSAGNVFYLSQDLCVFTVTPGLDPAPVAGVPFMTSNATVQDPTAAANYITALLEHINGESSFTTPSTTDPFSSFPSQFITDGDSSVTPSTSFLGMELINYNFAIARVRLNGPLHSFADDVKVFFRLFITQTSDTDYQPTNTYLSTLDASNLPSTPRPAPDGETTPFFASGSAAGDYGLGGANVKKITIESSDGAWAYFGCFLNVYDPALNLAMTGTHHCVVAQIAYDDAPIVNGNGLTASPETSDKLAQRNMQVTFSGNPSSPASHVVPQTFDVRPSAPLGASTGQLLEYPDELMIDWGNTPIGSTASIYWPGVAASDVLELARTLYATSQLSSSDAHTLTCPVTGGMTYVPIPPSGTPAKFAGLFTIDLPSTVVKGQEFNIVVRRVSSRRVDDFNLRAESVGPRPTVQRNWRYVVGTFAVKIPVAPEPSLLHAEENTYAIMTWRLGQTAPTNRWYPVLERYVGLLGARVNGFGGNAGGIKPSPIGLPNPIGKGGPKPGPGHVGHGEKEFTGKVAGIVYDRFGDFEGFLLLTESGHEHAFRAREHEIQDLVRFAWADRVVISVIVHDHRPEHPVSIVLRHMP